VTFTATMFMFVHFYHDLDKLNVRHWWITTWPCTFLLLWSQCLQDLENVPKKTPKVQGIYIKNWVIGSMNALNCKKSHFSVPFSKIKFPPFPSLIS